jgi:hypothetical protein
MDNYIRQDMIRKSMGIVTQQAAHEATIAWDYVSTMDVLNLYAPDTYALIEAVREEAFAALGRRVAA